MCSQSPYAVLRAVSTKNKDIDIVDSCKDEVTTLTVSNGDVQFGSSLSSDSSLKEQSEFEILTEVDGAASVQQTDGEEIIKSGIETGIEERSQPDKDERPCSPESVNKEVKKVNIEGNTKLSKKEIQKRTSDSALSRIESLLDDEFEVALDSYNEDLIQEIVRQCDHFEGQPLPQNLVKSVVSLTTPKDVLSTTPLEPPSFVEFSMAEDGFGCLFIPSLNPQSVSSESFLL